MHDTQREAPNPAVSTADPTASTGAARFDPTQYPLTESDRYELRDKRGFSQATIQIARLGSVRNQADVERLGIDIPFEELPSTVLIPYGPPDADGLYLPRLHKRSLRDTTYSPYVVVPRHDTEIVVIAESEFKALAAWQLGFNAIGMQGIHSFVNRMDELARAIRELRCSRVLVCLDTVRELGCSDE